MSSRSWAWLAMASSLLICAVMVWTSFEHQRMGERTAELVGAFRRARVDLATGFVQVVFGRDTGSTFRRDQGIALVDQAIADLQRLTTVDDADDSGDEVEAAAVDAVTTAARAFRAHLAAIATEGPLSTDDQARLRRVFFELDQWIEQLDQSNQMALQRLAERSSRTYQVVFPVGVVLLVSIGAGLYLANRASARFVAALQAAEDRLQAAVNSLADGVEIADRTGKMLHWNPAARKIHGMAPDETVPADLDELGSICGFASLDGRVLPREQWPWAQALRGDTIRDFQARLRRVDRNWERIVSCNGAIARDSSGEELAFLSFSDITERTRVVDELRLFRSLVDRTRDSIEVVDPETGRFRDVNEAGCKELGYTREEFLALRVFDIDPSMEPSSWLHYLERLRAHGSVSGEGRHRRRDGTEFPVEFKVTWVRLDRDYLVTVVRDITERKQAEARLLKANRALRILTECNQALVRAADEPELLRKICRALIEVGQFRFVWVGFAGDDASGMMRQVACDGVDDDILACSGILAAQPDDEESPAAAVLRTGRTMIFRDLASHPAPGTWGRAALQHGCAAIICLPLAGGDQPFGVLAVYAADPKSFDDEETALLTELADDLAYGIRALRTHKAHIQTEASLEKAQAIAHMGNWELDLNTGVGLWSREMFRLFHRDAALGPPSLPEFMENVHPDDRARLLATQDRVIKEGEPASVQFRVRSTGGSERCFEVIVDRILGDREGEFRLAGTVLDVTESVRAEQALRDSEARFRGLVEQSLAGIYVIAGKRFLYVSPGFARIFGYDSPAEIIENVEVPDMVAPVDRTKVRENIRRRLSGEINELHYEFMGLRRDGSQFNVEVQGRAVDYEGHQAVAGVLLDVTRRKQLEEQFRQAQKMEAIGTLAGGIAHDFNNILAAILGFAGVARLDAKGDPAMLEHLDAITEASQRATDLVRQILAFSRMESPSRQVLQLRHLVKEAAKLLRASIPATIKFESSIAVDAPPVLADASQVHQVIMNIGTNAAHAMKDRTGVLGFTLETCWVTPEIAATRPALRPGRYVRLSISDTGCGIDPAVIGRIFEPFFTTKGPREGTGLGLSVVHGIMQSHNGTVTVDSRRDQGARFDLYFPALDTEASEGPAEPTATPMGRREFIMLVDDELPLIRMGRRMLEHLGYQTEIFSDPETAWKAFQADPEKFDLVITDLTMPGIIGTELAARMFKVRPDLPIVLATGFSATLTNQELKSMGIRELLLKPFSVQNLGETVHRALTTEPT